MSPPYSPSAPNDDLSWLAGGGEMGALIRAMDWSTTPLGPPATWPQSLRTSVSLCLSSTFPILIAWGPDDIQIYNDAYRPICGDLHPASMGAPFKEVWASALPVVGDKFERAHQGEGTYIRDQRMFLDRYGYLEEAFMTFSFSPIRAESGEVGGIFHPISEATAAVLSARRNQCLRDLSAAISDARAIGDIGRDIEAQYQNMALDLPFVLLYQIDPDSGKLLLRAGAGMDAHAHMAPPVAELDDALWPFARTKRERSAQQADGLAARLGDVKCGPYDAPPDKAIVLPITAPGQPELYGFVVAGVSAARALDAEYLNFYELLGAAINTAVGNVVAYEKEQRRAEELAQIDRAKTAFFSNVSHEFRTPLTLILGPLDDALADREEALPPIQRRRIDVTHRNALRLLKLVNSLLDFSRIEAGRVQANYEPLDLARLTGDLASVFESAMDKGGLDYRLDLQDLGEPVYVDRDMWEKIVFNLLSNAFKFTLHGGVSVSLARHGDMARLSVRDTGSGIPEAELPRVFERFHRIEGTPGRTFEGTGIGLALIQELVRLHGGAIAVDSVLGEGTRFVVDIPFGHGHLPEERIVHAQDTRNQASDQEGGRMGAAFVEEALRWLPDETAPAQRRDDDTAPARAGATSGTLPRILIADDNNDMRAYLKSLLDPHAQVSVCADGEAAFALLQADPEHLPDLLLSDVMMPRLDGFGLIARIRASESLRHLPVMLLSARAGEEAKVEGLQAGADDYLVKPFAASELLARVQRQLELAAERRLQRDELTLRESYFHSIIDVAPVILWTTDVDGRCTYLSKRWYDYTGRTPEQDLGLGWLDNVHPDDMDRARDTFLDANARHAPFSLDYRLRRHDGKYRWFIDAGMPRFDDDGAPAGYVGTVVDIHTRTTLQQRLEQVARAGDIGVWYADAPFDKYRLNPQMQAHLGLEGRRDVAPGDLLGAVDEADRERLASCIEAATLRGTALDLEFRSGDGRRWLRAIGWCDMSAGSLPVRFDGVTFDISTHKHAEQELRRLAGELTEKNRMQSDFLFTLAHELRNPLAPIRTGLELLRIRAGNGAVPGSGEVHAMMRRQVDHMVRLVDDLLDMARLSEGKVELRRAPVELQQVVADALEISMPLVEGGGHRLALDLPQQAVVLHVDRHRVAQILSNLVNNAAKYTPKGGRIDVAARVDGNEVALSVRDNGIGIGPDMLPHVFDMYAQANNTHSMAQGGLGVGLNLVRRLVELHGGRVGAESGGPGQGSRFTVFLPLDLSAPVETPEAVAAEAARDAAALRVLVVDDNVDAAQTLGALLEMSGHAVRVVHDGAAALAEAPRFRPHAVFLDIGLPDRSGFDVAPELRRAEGMETVTLVALTGWGAEQDRQRSREAGFDAHLTKPADFDSVDSLLRETAARRAD
ncbi:ATP-binding protein [Massilia sp. YIM B02763]|uniref:ATP-binding protein n=1 Tax=Massilia sp. YIM B02763 TaxID=3050130 RepID=UPI0025B715EE|nr:ATP-binding protein [Massilia sp. YIM B02763]MDN4053541.1 ATP-binding protein [Massilia sp. YIM B02763]